MRARGHGEIGDAATAVAAPAGVAIKHIAKSYIRKEDGVGKGFVDGMTKLLGARGIRIFDYLKQAPGNFP
jgi:hypothetical protein